MSKTEATRELEYKLWRYTTKNPSVHGVFEVTVGYIAYGGKHSDRVDYVTCSTDGVIRAYEIKTSVADFHSDAVLSWVGDYNYLVLSRPVYDAVIKDQRNIPWNVGVISTDDHGEIAVMSNPRKVTRSIGQRTEIIESMMKAAARDAGKYYQSNLGQNKMP